LSRMLTAEQVAEQLGGLVSVASIHRWARLGMIPGSVKIGRLRFFDARSADWLLRPDGLPAKVMGPQPEPERPAKPVRWDGAA